MRGSAGRKPLTAKQWVEGVFGRLRWVGEAADPVVAGSLLVLGVIALICIALANHIFHGDTEARSHVIQVVGGFAVLLGAYFTAQHLVVQRAQQRAEMLSKLLDQAGSSEPAARLGAIRLLQVLVLDLPRTRGSVETTFALERAVRDALTALRESGCDPTTTAVIEDVLGMLTSPTDASARGLTTRQ